jgi:phosphate acetyltransferase
MPKTLDSIKQRAKEREKHIIVGDSTDERMLRAASIAMETGLARITLIGNSEDISTAAEDCEANITGIPILNPAHASESELYVEEYYDSRKSKIDSIETARNEVHSDPLLFGALAVRHGYADGMLAGSLSTTANVIRAGLRGIGLSPDMRVLSSMFLMSFPPLEGLRQKEVVFAFADGAVIPDPDPYQLADIAIASAKTYHQLTGSAPRVGMLSYSTKGSASSDETRKVITATDIVRERHPDLLIDGELQFDAAFVPEVSVRKAPDSPLQGNANVFIFPNLDAANIGYKIAERLGGGQAIGPILQGLAKPMNDLSRGARVDDIVTMIAVTVLQG